MTSKRAVLRDVTFSILAVTACGASRSPPDLTVAGQVLPTDLYGQGPEGVVIVAHGGYSTRPSWRTEARALAGAGFLVLVFETRGAVALAAGKETDCLSDAHCMAEDILAAASALRARGARSIGVIAGSAGGGGAAQAAIDAPGVFDRLVLLAPMAIELPERVGGRKLVAIARGDLGPADKPRLPVVEKQFERMPGPKILMILDGIAHGQRMFQSPQADSLRRSVVAFLKAP